MRRLRQSATHPFVVTFCRGTSALAAVAGLAPEYSCLLLPPPPYTTDMLKGQTVVHLEIGRKSIPCRHLTRTTHKNVATLPRPRKPKKRLLKERCKALTWAARHSPDLKRTRLPIIVCHGERSPRQHQMRTPPPLVPHWTLERPYCPNLFIRSDSCSTKPLCPGWQRPSTRWSQQMLTPPIWESSLGRCSWGALPRHADPVSASSPCT